MTATAAPAGAYLTAPNRVVSAANGIDFAYREVGEGAPALVLLQHFRGNLDSWDPALIDALARDRRVVTFDNAGVGGSTGTTPSTIAQMARDAIAFLDSLELGAVDLLGFSIGSFVAQEIALIRPAVVRRLVLASSAPRGAAGMHGWAPEVIGAVGGRERNPDGYLDVFFTRSEASRQAGLEALARLTARRDDRDTPTSWQTRQAQYDAVCDWGVPDHGRLQRVSAIGMPVFVANGDGDPMILPHFTHLLAGLIPQARMKLYPDAAHGFLFQHHAEFARDLDAFLTEKEILMSTADALTRPASDGRSELREGYAEVRDVRLHYVEAGDGPLVVLLHGFPEFWYGWRRQIGPLAAAGFRVVAPDLRGYNLSSKPDGVAAYSAAKLADDVRGLIEERGAECAHVVGHDWGGTAAWTLAMNHPEAVDRLAILNAAHPRKLNEGLRHPSQLRRSWYFFYFQLPDLPEHHAQADDWEFFQDFLRDAQPAYTPEEMQRYVEAWSQPGAATAMINYYRFAVRHSAGEIRPVTAPTLVIWGERDRYLGPTLAEPHPDDVPNLDRVERLPDASHWVHHDEPERVNRLLGDFFATAR